MKKTYQTTEILNLNDEDFEIWMLNVLNQKSPKLPYKRKPLVRAQLRSSNIKKTDEKRPILCINDCPLCSRERFSERQTKGGLFK